MNIQTVSDTLDIASPANKISPSIYGGDIFYVINETTKDTQDIELYLACLFFVEKCNKKAPKAISWWGRIRQALTIYRENIQNRLNKVTKDLNEERLRKIYR